MSRRTGRQFRGRSWASAADYLSPWLSACGKPFRSRRGQCAQRAAATSAIDDRRPGGNVRRRTPNALHRVEMGAWACAPNPATKTLSVRPPSRVRPQSRWTTGSSDVERTDVIAVAVQHALSPQKVHRVARLRHIDVCLPLQAFKDDVTSGILGDGVVGAVVR